MPAATALTKIGIELCTEFPGASNYSLARKLKAASQDAITFNAAEVMIRRLRGKQGKRNRTLAKAKRTSTPSSNPMQCPPSSAEPWLPVQIDGPCRVLALSDIHV